MTIVRAFLAWFTALVAVAGGAAAAKSVPESVHIDVWMRNESGHVITPWDNATDPYSPRRTCGACHNYPTVVSGDHFQRGAAPEGKPAPLNRFPKEGVLGSIRPEPYGGRHAYDWIALNAHHHPGGGPMEQLAIGGQGSSRPMSYVDAEVVAANPRNPHFASRLTPNGHSHFRASGALEADCLMCHKNTYHLEARNRQILYRNYRWAPVAGAGLGDVQGKVFDPGPSGGQWNFTHYPTVAYRWKDPVFTSDGKLSGRVIRGRVADAACLMCHRDDMAARTGAFCVPGFDVHARGGVRCADCHAPSPGARGGRLAHMIGRDTGGPGRPPGGQAVCVSCHMGGVPIGADPRVRARAKDPSAMHLSVFAGATFHLRLIACTACHITRLPAMGAHLLDVSTGKARWFSSDLDRLLPSWVDASMPSSRKWSPWIDRVNLGKGYGERYVPVSLTTAQWFAAQGPGGALEPLDGGVVARAAKSVVGLGTVEVVTVGGGKTRIRTVAEDKDIAAMIRALGAPGGIRPVFISDSVYELEGGRLAARALPFPNTVVRPVWHGVSPVGVGRTYGASGCTDCHSPRSVFFTAWRIRSVGKFIKVDGFEHKPPNSFPQMTLWGFDEVPSHE